MQNNESLYELIRFVASGNSSTADTPGSPASSLTMLSGETASQGAGQLEALRSLFQTQADATVINTQAISDNTKSRESATSESSTGKSAVSSMTTGLFLSPVISGLMKLFGGGSSDETPSPLEKFALPSSVKVQAGTSAGTSGISAIDYGQSGLPRPVSTTKVTVQVNAMDSRSFMDRSEDIAGAVRRAMLESSSLNDVVSEL